MNFYLLDAAAPGLVYGVMIVFMIITVILEAVTMIILKYNNAGKSFLDSFAINLVSLGVGMMIQASDRGLFDIVDSFILSIFILFLITVAVEFAILYLLNRKKPVQKTFITAVVINIISYLLFYLISVIF